MSFLSCATRTRRQRSTGASTDATSSATHSHTIYVFGKHRPGVTDIWQDFLKNRDSFGFSRPVAARTGEPLGAQLMEQGLGSLRGAIGTPDQVRELVRRYEEAGVDQLIFISQAGRNRHEDICESMELFAREVMPEFHERGWRRRRRTNRSVSDRQSTGRFEGASRLGVPPTTTHSVPRPSSSESGTVSRLTLGPGPIPSGSVAIHAVSDSA